MSRQVDEPEGEAADRKARSPMLFFALWFGLPLIAITAIGIMINHC